MAGALKAKQSKSLLPAKTATPVQKRTPQPVTIDPRERDKTQDRFNKVSARVPKVESETEEALELDIRAGQAESVFLSEYENMLRSNALLIRRFNEQLKGNLTSRDVYALSTLMSQQREVIADLRSVTDMSAQVGMVQDRCVTPFVSDITQTVTDVYYQLRKLLMETTQEKETQFALSQLDALIKQFGLGLQQSHMRMRSNIEEVLLGPKQTNTVKQKKRH
jgi:hypothetical protein